MAPAMLRPTLQPAPLLIRLAGLLMLLVLVSCGGDDTGDDTADGGDTTDETTTASASPDDDTESAPRNATQVPVVVPTSTPPPTATPLPTATPIPLDKPTPSAILLDTAFTNASKVTTVGIDEVYFGMTATEAAEAASTEWNELASTAGNCYRVVPTRGPEQVSLWVVDGHVERVDIEHPDIRTPSEFGLGTTLAQLQTQLGDRLTYDEASETATFTPSDAGDREFRMVFELVDDVVVRYRSGRVGVVTRSTADC